MAAPNCPRLNPPWYNYTTLGQIFNFLKA